MAAGFDIQRNPFQRWAVVGVGLHSRVDQLLAARLAFHPHRGGNKALHQIALRRADVAFIYRDAVFTQLFFQPHQLAVSAAVKAKNRLAMKILQIERSKAMAVFPLQQAFNLRTLGFGNERYGFLRRQRNLKRAVIGRQPESQFGALWGIPPVTGE